MYIMIQYRIWCLLWSTTSFDVYCDPSSHSIHIVNCDPPATNPFDTLYLTQELSDSVNNIHLSQVDVRVENIGQDNGSEEPSENEEDSCSVMSEVPPPPTPGMC